MRRATLQWLLRIGEAGPVQQLSQHNPITQLLALLLQVTGHRGSTAGAPQLTEFGCIIPAWSLSARSLGSASIASKPANIGGSSKKRRNEVIDGDGGDGDIGAGAPAVKERRSRKKDNFLKADNVVKLLSLSVRTRRPGAASFPSVVAVASPKAEASAAASVTVSNANSVTEAGVRPSGPQELPTGVSVSPMRGSSAWASSSSAVRRALDLEHEDVPQFEPAPKDSWGTRPGRRQNEQRPPPAQRSSYKSPEHQFNVQRYGSIAEALAAMERGLEPPYPHQLVSLLEKWNQNRGRGAVGDSNEVMARLDRLLLPHIKGVYGSSLDPHMLSKLLWTSVRSGLCGDSTLAIVDRFADAVRPGLPYTKSDYWATLALWSLGRAQQVARGAVAAGGGGGGGGWRGSLDAVRAAAAAAVVARARPRLLPALVGMLQSNAQEVNQQGMSNIFWAAGQLRIRDGRALAAFGRELYGEIERLMPQNISNIVYGCALLDLDKRTLAAVQSSAPFLDRLVLEAARRRLHGFTPQEVSNLIWASSKMDLPCQPLLETTADFIASTDYHKRAVAQEWSNTLYGMARKDFYDARVFGKLALTVCGPHDRRSDHHHQQHGALMAPASTAASAAEPLQQPPQQPPVVCEMLRTATPQTCSNLLFSLGTLRHLDERVVDAVMCRLLQLGPAASSADIALVVRACAHLNYRPPLLDSFMDACVPKLRADQHRLMAHNILWALMVLGMVSEPRHQPLVKLLVACINRYGTTAWSAAMATTSGGDGAGGAAAAAAAVPGFGTPGVLMDDLSQLLQYHQESRALGLTGEEYDLTPPMGIEGLVQEVRSNRILVAARSSSLLVQRKVVEMLRDMASSGAFPSILSVEAEVLLEPELMSVDIVVELAQEPQPGGQAAASEAAEADTNSRGSGASGDSGESSLVLAPSGDSRVGDDSDDDAPSSLPASRLRSNPPTKSGSASSSEPEPNHHNHQPPRQQRQAAPSATSYTVAVEVDGPWHFMRNRPEHHDGATALRDHMLARRFGGPANVLTVRTHTWVVQMRSDEERRQLLAKLLAKTVPPPPPPSQ